MFGCPMKALQIDFVNKSKQLKFPNLMIGITHAMIQEELHTY